MTPRKKLFIKTKEALLTIPQLELVDFYRRQFDSSENNYPEIWTATLIRVNSIRYEAMSDGADALEGKATIEVLLYCKDGWMDQHNDTGDPQHGLMEIDLIDSIIDRLQYLKGDCFTPLQISSDETENIDYSGMMSYRLTFETTLFKQPKLQKKYALKKINLNP